MTWEFISRTAAMVGGILTVLYRRQLSQMTWTGIEGNRTGSSSGARETTGSHRLLGGTGAIWRLVSRANKYIDETAPWVLAREEASRGRLATVIYNLVESIRIITVAAAPFMPTLPVRVNEQFSFFKDPERITWEEAKSWGLLVPGGKVHKKENLFPRVEADQHKKMNAKKEDKGRQACSRAAQNRGGYATIEDFACDLRVAEVKAAEKMKADKLWVLTLRVGMRKGR